MFRSTWTTRRILLGAVAIGVMVCATTKPTVAQMARPATRTSTFDLYNNARPSYLERRQIGLFQNVTQRSLLRGFQSTNRRVNRRGGVLPFSLGGDRLRAAAVGSGLLSRRSLGGEAFSLSRAGAFDRFGNRQSSSLPVGTAAAAIERRRNLLAGSSRNAPIFRALQRMGRTGLGAQRTLEETPFVQAQPETPEPDEPQTALHDFLNARADLDRSRLRSEAWEDFRSGKYLDAARSFATATRLDPSDNVSRTGELLCHVIVKMHRTALVVFNELVRHDENLFGHALEGSGVKSAAPLFGDPGQVGRLRSAARLRTGPSESNLDVRAMHLLMLWHLGETSEAQRGAVALSRDFPASPYAAWPGKMRGAIDRQRRAAQDAG